MAIVRVDNEFQNLSPNTKLIAVRVTDIILGPNHPKFKKYGEYDSIGTIFYTRLNKSNPKTDSIARPLFSFIKNYPLINEVVLITSSKDKDNTNIPYYFPTLNIHNHPHHNAAPNVSSNFTPSQNSRSRNQYIENIENTPLSENESNNIILGDYFKEKSNIKPLLPYEGDTIIEGRFGNSIRFGSTSRHSQLGIPNSWSSVGELGDPITIIKNGQSNQLDNKGWIHDIENITNDASSIYMTSNQRLQNFTPASLNQLSFGANLVPVLSFSKKIEQLRFVPEEETIDFSLSDDEILFNSVPETATTSSDDSFDNAEEILDSEDFGKLKEVSGTEEDQTEVETSVFDGEIETNETNNTDYNDVYEELGLVGDSLKNAIKYDVRFDKPIKSLGRNTTLTCQTPISVDKIINQIEQQIPAANKEYLVIHTSATPYRDHLSLAMEFMINYKWGYAGYHIPIDDKGNCVQCYEDGIVSSGVGTAGKRPDITKPGGNESLWSDGISNSNTINISWIGGRYSMNITASQINAIEELIKLYVRRYPNIKVLGHNQISAKQCPWFDVRKYCKLIGIPSKNIFLPNYNNTDTPGVRKANIEKFGNKAAGTSKGINFSKLENNHIIAYNLNREPSERIEI